LPELSDKERIWGVGMDTIEIGGKRIGESQPVFIVAETANAHNGDFGQAKALVRAAAEAEADAVKIQFIRADGLVVKGHPRHAHFKKLEFYDEQWAELFRLAGSCRLPVWADVFDAASVDTLLRLGVAGFKIHASDTCNEALIRRVADAQLPVLLSAGGAVPEELDRAIAQLRAGGPCPIVLMHGYQAYPTDPRDLHLRRLAELKARFDLPVGLQDHLDGASPKALLVPQLALGFGLAVIEKHLTLNRASRGIDFYSALNPDEFRRMVQSIREAEAMLGSARLTLSEQERVYRQQVRKVLVAAKPTRSGEQFRAERLTGKRADEGLSLDLLPKVVGRRAKETVHADQPILPQWVEWNTVVMVAVRMHSTRLPGKALLPIEGKPAILHLLERLTRAAVPKAVVLCTSTHADDQVLKSLAEQAGVGFFAGSEDDVMQRFLDAAEREQAEHVVRVTGDDLLVDPAYLDRLVLHHIREGADYTAAPGLPKGTECEAISVQALKKARELAEDSSWSEYMTWYLKVPEVFRVAELPVEETVRRPHYRLTLDYEQDLDVVRRVFGGLARTRPHMAVADIVAFLDANPDVAQANAQVPSKPLPAGLNVRLRKEAQHVHAA
jgi:N,N'-diacetyllegionaminate synthase